MKKEHHKHIQELINDPERIEKAELLLAELKHVIETHDEALLTSHAAKVFQDGLLHIASSEYYMTSKDRLTVQKK